MSNSIINSYRKQITSHERLGQSIAHNIKTKHTHLRVYGPLVTHGKPATYHWWMITHWPVTISTYYCVHDEHVYIYNSHKDYRTTFIKKAPLTTGLPHAGPHFDPATVKMLHIADPELIHKIIRHTTHVRMASRV